MTSLERALLTVVNALNESEFPYAVMGGLAVRAYAIPRFTSDVDLTVSVVREQLPSHFDLLRAVGCKVSHPYLEGWLEAVAGLPLFRADFLDNDRVIEIDQFVVDNGIPVIVHRSKAFDSKDLVLLKLIASRPNDLIDLDRRSRHILHDGPTRCEIHESVSG